MLDQNRPINELDNGQNSRRGRIFSLSLDSSQRSLFRRKQNSVGFVQKQTKDWRN